MTDVEPAPAGIATADFGTGAEVLIDVSAARLPGAIPRAVAQRWSSCPGNATPSRRPTARQEPVRHARYRSPGYRAHEHRARPGLEQVRRGHLISPVLAAISRTHRDACCFPAAAQV